MSQALDSEDGQWWGLYQVNTNSRLIGMLESHLGNLRTITNRLLISVNNRGKCHTAQECQTGQQHTGQQSRPALHWYQVMDYHETPLIAMTSHHNLRLKIRP